MEKQEEIAEDSHTDGDEGEARERGRKRRRNGEKGKEKRKLEKGLQKIREERERHSHMGQSDK